MERICVRIYKGATIWTEYVEILTVSKKKKNFERICAHIYERATIWTENLLR